MLGIRHVHAGFAETSFLTLGTTFVQKHTTPKYISRSLVETAAEEGKMGWQIPSHPDYALQVADQSQEVPSH